MSSHGIYTLSNSAGTRISPPGTHSGVDITVQNNNSAGYIYLGAENVSASSYGIRILPEHAVSFELPGQDALYAIGASAGMTAAVLITGLEAGS